jgi:beta-galactosidase
MDYLGEVGVGAWEYPAYAPRSNQQIGWVSAGSGRIDLTGKPLAEMAYTQVAFEQRNIAIGVYPVKFAGEKHSPSAWKMTAAVESWSWNGCDGMPATVEVYARAHHVSLFVNGTRVGTKYPKHDCKVTFRTAYHDGTLKAVAYDRQNSVLAEQTLQTAGAETVLSLRPEQNPVGRDGELCYVRLCFTDQKGILKPLERADIQLSVQGGQLLACGSACPFYPRSYLDPVTDTYYGEALAILKPDQSEQMVLTAESRLGSAAVTIQID